MTTMYFVDRTCAICGVAWLADIGDAACHNVGEVGGEEA